MANGKAKLLNVITRANLGGAQKHLLWLIEALRHRYSIRVITGERDYLTDRLDEFEVEYEYLPNIQRSLSPIRDLVAIYQLRRAIRSFQPDLLHLHSFKASMLGRIAALGLRTRVIVTAHGLSFTDDNPRVRKWIGERVERMLAPVTDQLVVVCQRDYEALLSRGITGKNKTAIVHNGVPDINQPTSEGRQGSNGVSLIFVGRLCAQKNQFALLEVLHGLPDTTTLTLVGDGPDHGRIVDLIGHHNFGSRVVLDTDNPQPQHRLRTADIYISASRWEGLSLSMIEALRAGLPIVATDVGGTGELVEHGQNGYLVESATSENLISAINTLIADPDRRNAMGRASRKRYLDHFQVDKFVDRTESIYQKLLDSRS